MTDSLANGLTQIVVSLLSIGGAYLLFWMQSKRDAPVAKTQEHEGHANALQTMQKTIDGIAQDYEEIRTLLRSRDDEIDELKSKLDDNTMLLSKEIEIRRGLEGREVEYREGIEVLIVQLRELGIEPEWTPDMVGKKKRR